jgi:prephenate dehydrogenase
MKIAVVGLGRMGTWFARNLVDDHSISVNDLDETRMARFTGAVRLGSYGDLSSFRPQLLVNAVPLGKTIEVFQAVVPFLDPGCLLCDMASIKGEIPRYYAESGFRFVSIHPMFGPTFSDMERVRHENAIIIEESDPDGADFFRRFFLRFEIALHEYSFAEHDRLMAYSLSLPFISSMVFASRVDVRTVPGTTFRKHLELARGVLSEDDNLLSEVLFNPHTLGELEKTARRLDYLTHIIRDRDSEEMQKVFRGLRENLVNSSSSLPKNRDASGG